MLNYNNLYEQIDALLIKLITESEQVQPMGMFRTRLYALIGRVPERNLRWDNRLHNLQKIILCETEELAFDKLIELAGNTELGKIKKNISEWNTTRIREKALKLLIWGLLDRDILKSNINFEEDLLCPPRVHDLFNVERREIVSEKIELNLAIIFNLLRYEHATLSMCLVLLQAMKNHAHNLIIVLNDSHLLERPHDVLTLIKKLPANLYGLYIDTEENSHLFEEIIKTVNLFEHIPAALKLFGMRNCNLGAIGSLPEKLKLLPTNLGILDLPENNLSLLDESTIVELAESLPAKLRSLDLSDNSLLQDNKLSKLLEQLNFRHENSEEAFNLTELKLGHNDISAQSMDNIKSFIDFLPSSLKTLRLNVINQQDILNMLRAMNERYENKGFWLEELHLNGPCTDISPEGSMEIMQSSVKLFSKIALNYFFLTDIFDNEEDRLLINLTALLKSLSEMYAVPNPTWPLNVLDISQNALHHLSSEDLKDLIDWLPLHAKYFQLILLESSHGEFNKEQIQALNEAFDHYIQRRNLQLGFPGLKHTICRALTPTGEKQYPKIFSLWEKPDIAAKLEKHVDIKKAIEYEQETLLVTTPSRMAPS